MEAKYVIFLLTLVIGVPAGVIACMCWRRLTDVVLVVLIWATCEPDLVGINFVSREFYRANTRGFEISLVDMCVLVLLFVMILRRKEQPFRWCPPLTLPFLLYFLVGVISWMQAGPSLPVPDEASVIVPYTNFEVGLYPLFELSKIFRGYLLYLAIINFIRDERTGRVVLTGIALTVLYMSWEAISSRYLHGVNRVRATLGHPNSLATYMAMVGTFMYAFILQRKGALISGAFGMLTLLAGVSVILTVSRGGLAALAMGIWINTMALLPRNMNLKNFVFLALGLIAAVAILLVAMDTLLNRFTKEQDAAADLAYRGLYNAEARLMARDRVFGVGLGNFSAWSWSKYAGEVDPDLPPGTPAHNNWYLNLGELGRPGLVVFILLWLRFFSLALPLYFRRGKGLLSALGMASCTAVLVDHLQSCLQLGYRQTPMYFMMTIFMGITMAVWYAKRDGVPEEPPTEPAPAPGDAIPV